MANISLNEYYASAFPTTDSNLYDSQKNFENASRDPFGVLNNNSGGSSGGYSSVVVSNTNQVPTSSTTTTTPNAPNQAMPTLAGVPAIDETRIKRLTQTRSAAGQRSLRSALRESLLNAKYSDNPNVAALVSRKALEGFGQGIAETYTKAQQQATAEENYNRQLQVQHDQAVFNASMQDYLRRFGSTSTQNTTYSNAGNSGQITPVNSGYIKGGQTSQTTGGPAIGSTAWAQSQFLLNTGRSA